MYRPNTLSDAFGFQSSRLRRRSELSRRLGVRAGPPSRNRIVGGRQAGERAADGRGEEAGRIVGRGHPRQACDAPRAPGSLVVREEERLAPHNGPAKISPGLILVIRWLGRV